jgi:mycothiol S-conjugate amidase
VAPTPTSTASAVVTHEKGHRFVEERTDSLSPVSERLTLLSVHAHPDDEASKGAPTVAKYHAAGVHTVLVCCTGGEEGELQNPTLREEGQALHGLSPEEERAKVASMRPAELAASAAVIGFDEVVMLGYRDSGMPDSEANRHPDSFHQADLDEATGRLVAIIRRTRPQILITYGDDQRGYPHPDHLRVHDISVLAFERAGDADWYPSAGEPYQPAKLYYSAWSMARIVAIHEALLRLRGESPYDAKWFDRPNIDHRITTRIDVSGFMWARTGALRAHATQVDPNEQFWFGLSEAELVEAYAWEDWILARSFVGPIPEDDGERDMFAGIAAEVLM